MRRHGIPFRILVMLSKVLSLCSKSKAGGPPPEVPAVSDSPAGVPPFVLKHGKCHCPTVAGTRCYAFHVLRGGPMAPSTLHNGQWSFPLMIDCLL